jgi:hypothetical protein
MKLSKKIGIFLVTTTAVTLLGGAASHASIGSGDAIKYIKQNFLSFLPQEVLDLVGDDGEIRLENVLVGIYDRAIKGSQQPDKTIGAVASDLAQDSIELINKANTTSYENSLKEFKDSASSIEQTASENETASDSSLEAADKANRLQSAQISVNQRQVKIESDLTRAMQIANAIKVQEGREQRVERLKADIKTKYYSSEVDRIRDSINNRFYLPDAEQPK